MIRVLLAFVVAMLPAIVHAQPVVSPGPDSVAVTIYRNPDRGASDEIDLEWLEGFALITERRTVTIPTGRALIRFEGVASGILPESAIVAGLPAGVREKNLDADLLSPRSLYARSFGRPVTIRRTIDGRQVEEAAIIRSGPDGAAILKVKGGFIAANCGPYEEELVYGSVPPGLSAKPTLSVETDAPQGGTVTVTLSYLAAGFDWQANYVATMRPDGRTADLIGWVTLASQDVTSFPDAETMVVAGRLARDDAADTSFIEAEEQDTELALQCFGGTYHPVPPPEPAPPPTQIMTPAVGQRMPVLAEENIVVTGSRIVRQEELGDLKLYRVPDRTTVASNGQKQVMLLQPRAVKLDVLYRARIFDDEVGDEPALVLRVRNRKGDGLGLPLPSGGVALFQPREGARLLVGEASMEDKAVDEEIELEFEESSQVDIDIDDITPEDAGLEVEMVRLTVTNANPWPIRFEGEFSFDERNRFSHPSARMRRRNGHDIWATTVPAGGSASLDYRLTDLD